MIELRPETEQLVRDELRSGRFHSVDDLIVSAVRALREQQSDSSTSHPPQSLSEFFRQSPLVGLELDLHRDHDPGRDLAL